MNKIINDCLGKRKLIFALLVCAAIATGCSKTIYPSAWQATPVTTDGSLSDWTLPLAYYDEDTRLNYSITNDAQNLYICMRVNDAQTQMKMLRAGFSLWLDVAGKKDQTTGIMYPLSQKLLAKPDESTYQRGSKPDIKKMRKQMLAEQSQMEVIGFRNATNGRSLMRTKEGIAVAMNADSTGDLIYEATIPFKTFYKDSISASDTLKMISVGMEVNGIEMQAGGEHKEGGEGGSHGGGGGGGGGGSGMSMGGGGGMGGGMHGGGMHGGGGGRGGGTHGGGSGSGDRSTLSETKSVWNYIKPSLR